MAWAPDEEKSAPLSLALCAALSCVDSRFSEALRAIFASRAAKKREILQSEAKKLEQRLRDRTAVLSQLRRHHEELLSVNGQLQQRKNARRAKLDRLRESIELGSSPESERSGRLFSAAVKDAATVSDKHSAMKTVLVSLGEQRQRLEQKAMGVEEELTRKSRSLGDAVLQLREAKETSQLRMEDARSLHWELELEEFEVAAAENRLRQVGQQLQLETLQLDTLTNEYQAKLAAYEDLSKVRDNFRAMAKEAHDQLQIEKVEATRNWRSTVGMMERHGPTCAKDNEVREIQVQLLAQLENLTPCVSATKSARRELVFQIKQEKEMLSLTKSSVKAKRDQMEWLKRQRAFLESEYRSLIESRSASEQAYHESVKMHKGALAKLDDEKAAAKSTLKQIEGEIASSEANAKALSTQISDERKRLNQQLRKRRTKEKKQKSSSVNLDAMRAEIDSARQILAKTQSAQLKQQELLDKMTAENEELQHTLTNLQKQTQDDERALQELSDAGAKPAEDIVAAKKELRSILQDPNFSDWENIIEWVNQKIAEERSDAHAQLRHDRVVSAKSLRERFEAKFKALDEKCGKMLGEKRSIYDGMVKKKQSNRRATTSGREGTLETLSRSSTNKHQTRGEYPDPKSSGKLSAEDLHKNKAKPDGNPVQEKSTTHKTAHPSDTIQPVPRLDADSRSNTATPSPIISPAPSLSPNVSSHQLATPPERVSVPRQHGSSTRKKLNPRAKPQAPAGNLVTTPTTAARPRAQRSLSPSGECVSSGERMSQSAMEHSSTADSRFLHDDKENMPPPRASSINQAKSSTQLKQPQPQPKRRSALSQAAIATRGKLKVTKAKVGASIAIKRGTKKLPLSGRKIKSSGSGIIGSTTMTPSTASSSSATRRFASDWLAGDGFSFD